uniref:site-specific DNA-methyltransferase (adenine-specific) n=1 Tax=viral metagenome TaxID=1070528 RepID=A0A6C0E245_9ZZZZ
MKLKTFIRWMGNKSKHLRHIIPHIPKEYNTYYEPFVGSGALFLHLQPEKWVINDLNKDLINCWKSVRDEPEMIIDIFKEFGKKFKPMSNERKLEYCINITSYIEKMPFDVSRASIFMLMKYCDYMGNIVVKNKFYFQGLNLSILNYDSYYFLKNVCHKNMTNIHNFLRNGLIYNKDYKKILDKSKEGDFVFLDPPYIEEHKYQFNYNIDENLNKKFILELYDELKKLDKKKVKWLMTQADTKEVRNVFKEYTIKKFKVYRSSLKSYKNELIIKNY